MFSKNELALCVHPSYKQIQSVKKKKSTPVPGELPQEAYTQVRQDLLLKVTYFMLATERKDLNPMYLPLSVTLF